MTNHACPRCGNTFLIQGFISLRCPICGEVRYLNEAPDSLLWSEHKLGLLFRKGGWDLLGLTDPPAWFLENVV